MRRTRLGLALGMALACTGGASADVLISPPLVAEGKNLSDCYLANVGKSPRSVRIEAVNRQRVVVRSISKPLGPGEEDVVRVEADLLARYCRFTVQGAGKSFRASVLVRQDGVGALSALRAY